MIFRRDGTRANDYGWDTTIPAKGEDLSYGEFMRKWGRDCIFLGREVRTLQGLCVTLAILNTHIGPLYPCNLVERQHDGRTGNRPLLT